MYSSESPYNPPRFWQTKNSFHHHQGRPVDRSPHYLDPVVLHHSPNTRLSTADRGRFRPRVDGSCYEPVHVPLMRQAQHPARSLDQSPRGRGNHYQQKHGPPPTNLNNVHQKRPQYYKSSLGHPEHDFTPFYPDPGEKCSYTN